MIRIAGERILRLFALAENESRKGRGALPDRYVRLARKIGTRYNVRIPAEFTDRYCRGCSSYWVEGRSVRTRLRRFGRTQTCLVCGRIRRVRLGDPVTRAGEPWAAPQMPERPQGAALVEDGAGDDDEFDPGDEVG
jgi:ribonuclease P protein subunit RPR2